MPHSVAYSFPNNILTKHHDLEMLWIFLTRRGEKKTILGKRTVKTLHLPYLPMYKLTPILERNNKFFFNLLFKNFLLGTLWLDEKLVLNFC